ncbi:hypothetical protein HX798_29100 [Pseudomonas putida]|uniref:Uncharacterized protein n=1 Tax=Pseudomonas putida TaxID=303 RepID=A0A7Y8D5E4_PSEPU|nr:hypothetical protein [Pseudomonas putida]
MKAKAKLSGGCAAAARCPRRIVVKDGVVCGFHDEINFEGLTLESYEKKRVSKIIPDNFFLRGLFYILRIGFGEVGVVSDWTRSWRCTWLLVIDADSKGRFHDRQEAIRFEKELIFQQGKLSVERANV